MKVNYEYDQDPRYGWASIDLEESKDGLIIIHGSEVGSMGFTFKDGIMISTCICHAWSEDECACPSVEWRNKND